MMSRTTVFSLLFLIALSLWSTSGAGEPVDESGNEGAGTIDQSHKRHEGCRVGLSASEDEMIAKSELKWKVTGHEAKMVWRHTIVEDIDLCDIERRIRDEVMVDKEREINEAVRKAIENERAKNGIFASSNTNKTPAPGSLGLESERTYCDGMEDLKTSRDAKTGPSPLPKKRVQKRMNVTLLQEERWQNDLSDRSSHKKTAGSRILILIALCFSGLAALFAVQLIIMNAVFDPRFDEYISMWEDEEREKARALPRRISGNRWSVATSHSADVAKGPDTVPSKSEIVPSTEVEDDDIKTIMSLYGMYGSELLGGHICTKDKKLLHLGLLVLSTLWWYVYSGIIMWETPAGFLGFSQWAIYCAAAYAPISQIIVYGALWKLMTAGTLRAAQAWVVVCIIFCVPADTLIVLFEPAGCKFKTVLVFALVTMCYGIILAHYVRLACRRENADAGIPTERLRTMRRPSLAYPGGPLQYLVNYRTPENIQAMHMATDFARSFCGFTVAIAAFRDSFVEHDEAQFWVLASCVIVGLHSTIEMILTTIFPGADLNDYSSFVRLKMIATLVDIIASLLIGQATEEHSSIWDELIFSWLFGNATADFMDCIALMARGVNYDMKLGLIEE